MTLYNIVCMYTFIASIIEENIHFFIEKITLIKEEIGDY